MKRVLVWKLAGVLVLVAFALLVSAVDAHGNYVECTHPDGWTVTMGVAEYNGANGAADGVVCVVIGSDVPDGVEDFAGVTEPSEPVIIHEDEPGWDCHTMGNRRCGPQLPEVVPEYITVLPELGIG